MSSSSSVRCRSRLTGSGADTRALWFLRATLAWSKRGNPRSPNLDWPKGRRGRGGGDGSLLAPGSKCRRCLSAPRDQHCFHKRGKRAPLGPTRNKQCIGCTPLYRPTDSRDLREHRASSVTPKNLYIESVPAPRRALTERQIRRPLTEHKETAYVVSARRHVPSTRTKIKQRQWTHLFNLTPVRTSEHETLTVGPRKNWHGRQQ